MRNEKFHKENHCNFVPTLEQANTYFENWLKFYRSQPCPHVPGKTIGQVFNEGRGTGVDINILDELMLASDARKVGRNGVKFLNAHYFAEELYGLKENVIIRYNLLDLSSVKVYTQKGEFICTAQTSMEVHPLAGYMGDATDMSNLKNALKQQKKLRNQTMRQAVVHTKQVGNLLAWQEPKLIADCGVRVSAHQRGKPCFSELPLIQEKTAAVPQLETRYEFKYDD
jgi:putative transposase